MADEIKKDTVDYRDPTPFDGSKLQSISDISKAIRHKEKGEDVREPIAQQGEALVKIMQETGGNQSAEVVAARGNHALLPMREDAQDRALEQASIDSETAIQMAKQLASGSPAGTYATVADLATAKPTGDNNIYVITADKKWYYYNSTTKAWTAGGTYLADSDVNAVSEKANAAASNLFAFDDSPMALGFSKTIQSQFARGMVSTVNGNIDFSSTNRAYSSLINIVGLDWKNTLVNFFPKFGNYKLGIAQYDIDGNHLGNIGYFTSNKSLAGYVVVPTTASIRWIVATNDNHDLSQSEIDRFSAYVILLYGKVQIPRVSLSLDGEEASTVYTVNTDLSNTRKRKPLIIFDDISMAHLNTDEISKIGIVVNGSLYTELLSDITLDTSNLATDSNKSFLYEPATKTLYVVDGVRASDYVSLYKNSVYLGYVTYTVPEISNTKIQVMINGKLVLPYDNEYNERLKNLEASQEVLSKPLAGNYFSVLGDSISRYKGFSESGTGWGGDQYPNGNVTSDSQMWWGIVRDKTGMNISKINANSGSTCSTANSDRIEASSDYRTSKLDDGTHDPDIIICEIGTNDFIYAAELGSYDGSTALPTDTSTFKEAYANMLNKVQNNYPNAKIYGCTVHQNLYSTYLTVKNNLQTVVNSAGLKLSDLNDAIREICGLYGAGVIDLESCGLSLKNIAANTTDTTTNVHLHPNKVGQEMFANKVIATLAN